jgi:hypothetical protein
MTPFFALFGTVFAALMLWRGSFTALTLASVAGGSAAQQRRKSRALQHRVHILDNRLLTALLERQERADTYLRRIVALSGAEKTADGYSLDVGTIRFCVSDRHVTRQRRESGSELTSEETCFYSLRGDIPRTEEIASALIQLKNNPALFDHWAIQRGAVKADGQPFSSKH